MSDGIAVVIPTLNEVDSIGRIIDELMNLEIKCTVIIVDDQSTDGTCREISIKKKLFPNQITLIVREDSTNGLAGAYLRGYSMAKELGFEWVVQMDADGQHSPKDISELWQQKSKQKVVVGSRYCPGGTVHGWGKLRLLISKIGNWYFRALHNTQTRDCTGGFRLSPLNVLDQIWLIPPSSKGFTFHAESTYRCIQNSIRIIEVPINFEVRENGNSKMNFWNALESLHKITKWKFKK
jgi:dolichol-phosphate mannosyltransferase